MAHYDPSPASSAQSSLPPSVANLSGEFSPPRRLRTACDYCHEAKVRCSGGERCLRCQRDDISCHRSYTAKMGKPRGSRKRKPGSHIKTTPQTIIEGDKQRGGTWSIENELDTNTAIGEYTNSTIEGVIDEFSWPSRIFSADQQVELSCVQDTFGVSVETHNDLDFTASTAFLSALDFGISVSDSALLDVVGVDHSIDQSLSFASDSELVSIGDAAQLNRERIHRTPAAMASPVDLEERGRRDNLNPMVRNCSRKLFTPPRSTYESDRGDETPTINRLDTTTQMHRQQHAAKLPCACVQRQASILSQLHAIERQHPSMQLDTMLHYTSQGMQVAVKILRCIECRHDVRVLLTTIMVFQTIFRWAESVCHAEDVPCPRLELRMGQYSLSGSDSWFIKDAMSSRVFCMSKQALDLLKDRVDQTQEVIRMSDRSKAEAEYLEHSHQVLLQTLVRLSRRLHSVNPCGHTFGFGSLGSGLD